MTVSATPAVTHDYSIHGVGLAVRADDPATLAAVDERLRSFRVAPGDRSRAEIAIAFEHAGRHEPLDAPPEPTRPVYDTPYGQVLYCASHDLLHGELDGVRMSCAAGAGVARLQSAGFAGRRRYLATHPLLTLALMELLERRGHYALHAACLARGGNGVLVAGPTGAGKSTLAMALVRRGLGFLSDDVVFLAERGDGAIRALGFADALGVTDATLGRFPELAAATGERRAGFPKRLVRPEAAFVGLAPLAACVPRALVLTEVAAGRRSTLVALDPADAWLRLVPDVLLTQPHSTQAHLRALAALLGQVRTYAVRSGADLERAAELVDGTLEETGPWPRRPASSA